MITIQRYKNYLIIQIYLLSFLPNRIPNPEMVTSTPNLDGDPEDVSVFYLAL